MTERTKHISSSFDAALYGLKNDVLMMSCLTDRIFQTAFEALLKRDSELCDHVVAEDEEIDILEKQVDQEGVNLLLRFHPVASDMREVVSAMKISASLERIADQSVTIARRAKRLNNSPALRELALLEPPYRLGACDGGGVKPGIAGCVPGCCRLRGRDVIRRDTGWPVSHAQGQAQYQDNHQALSAGNPSPNAGAVGRLIPVHRIVRIAVIGHVDLLTAVSLTTHRTFRGFPIRHRQVE